MIKVFSFSLLGAVMIAASNNANAPKTGGEVAVVKTENALELDGEDP